MHGFTTRGPWFIDPQGRHALMRGVNLSGSTKVPFEPPSGTQLGVDFDNWRDISFVGKPAPLDEIDRHLERIAHWGFNILRFLVTWEAIEHRGPQDYDEPYLEYVTEVVRRAGTHGLYVFIDPHHDVWSRWTGGDGAPMWCFDWAGLDPSRFVETDAVALNSFDWPSNYNRVPVATMWTLFYGGDEFCPSLKGVQDQLQSHYNAAVRQVALRVHHMDHVLGYDSLNEPSYGYIGRTAEDMRRATRMFDRGDHHQAPFSPLELLAAADGITVRHDDGGVVNEAGRSIWRDGCPWRAAGVWDLDADGRPTMLDETYFSERGGETIKAFRDFVVPAIDTFRTDIRKVQADAIIFIEGAPDDFSWEWDDPDPLIVNGRHWYDVTMLGTRRFDPDQYKSWFAKEPVSGAEAIGDIYAAQMQQLADLGTTNMSGRPTLFGELGVTYDMNDGESLRSGDYRPMRIANDAIYRALDATLTHSTQWNYTPDNTHAHGDQWNEEDLSIFSPDDQHDPSDIDSGGRGTEGFCRPHVLAAAGEPTSQRFDTDAGRFELTIHSDSAVATAAPTVVYIPRLHYPNGADATVSNGSVEVDLDGQRLVWEHAAAEGPVTLTVAPSEG